MLPHGPFYIRPEGIAAGVGVKLDAETRDGGQAVPGDECKVVGDVGADAEEGVALICLIVNAFDYIAFLSGRLTGLFPWLQIVSRQYF